MRLIKNQTWLVFQDNFLRYFNDKSACSIFLTNINRFLDNVARAMFDFSIYFSDIFSHNYPKSSTEPPPSNYNGATVEVQPGIATPNILTIRLQDSISRANK